MLIRAPCLRALERLEPAKVVLAKGRAQDLGGHPPHQVRRILAEGLVRLHPEPAFADLVALLRRLALQTQQLFDSYPGLGGVQVTTLDGRERLIARAILKNGTLHGATWKKAIGLAGRARMEGTQRPSYILDLIDYGEDLVEHEYSSRYVTDGQ